MKPGHRKAGCRGGQAARGVVRAVTVVRLWPAVCLVAAATTLALPSTSSAFPPPSAHKSGVPPDRGSAENARASSGVTLGIASLYKVTVPPGTWVPIALSVANDGAANLRGEIVVRAPAAQEGLSTPGCLSNGPFHVHVHQL